MRLLLLLIAGLLAGLPVGRALFSSSKLIPLSSFSPAQPTPPAKAQVSHGIAAPPSEAPATADPYRGSDAELCERLDSIILNRQEDLVAELKRLVAMVTLDQMPELLSELFKLDGVGLDVTLLFKKWVGADFAAARVWASGLKEGHLKNVALDILATAAAARDPAQAFALVSGMSRFEAADTVGNIFASWTKSNPNLAIANLAHLSSPELREKAVQAIALAWAGKDRQAALKWVASQPPTGNRQHIHLEILRSWAGQEPQGALEYIRNLPETERRTNAYETGYSLAFGVNPSAALAFADLLPPGNSHDDLLSMVVSKWMEADPAKARQWVQMQTDGHLRSVVLPILMDHLASSNPRSAMEMVASMPQDAARGEALVKVASRWVENDPGAALAYFKPLPSAPAEVYSSLSRRLAKSDPGKAADLLRELPGGSRRDAAIEGFVSATVEYDPASAGQWALGVSDPKLRNTLAARVYRKWSYYDIDGADGWIAQPGFPAEVRKSMKR